MLRCEANTPGGSWSTFVQAFLLALIIALVYCHSLLAFGVEYFCYCAYVVYAKL